MENDIRVRLAAELAAKGIGLKEASSKAKWPNGKPLGLTYARDVTERGKGRHEGVEALCLGNGLTWPYVKTGNRGNGASHAAAPNGSLEQDLHALLAERRELVARKRALDEQIIALTELLHGGR